MNIIIDLSLYETAEEALEIANKIALIDSEIDDINIKIEKNIIATFFILDDIKHYHLSNELYNESVDKEDFITAIDDAIETEMNKHL